MILDDTTDETVVVEHLNISFFLKIKCQSCDQMQIVVSTVDMYFSIIPELFL